MSTSVRTVDDLVAEGVRDRRVLVRSDLNVPLDGAGTDKVTITDDGRIRASVPVIRKLADAGARVVVCAHLGRPKGEPDPRYTLAPVAQRLAELLGLPVHFATDVVDQHAQAVVGRLVDGGVALLENVRFEPAETSKDEAARLALAKRYAAFADAYVDDAFGAVHRKHASVYDVATLLPHYAGDLVRRELEVLRQLTGNPPRPYVVVLGGAKVADKLPVIESLLPQADTLLIGGGMGYTFLAAQGHEVGGSLLDADHIDTCRELLAKAAGKIVLASDIVVASEFSADATTEVVASDKIPADQEGMDIGPETVARFSQILAGAATVFWNGPMGVFELAPFANGTRGVGAAVTKASGLTVVGGGDSAAAVRTLGLDESAFGHISTGGGASLEYLEGRTLPGVAVLED